MGSAFSSVTDLRQLDQFATGDSIIHRLDARAKVLVVCAFLLTVVSFNRYELSALAPLFLFPVVMVALADLPSGYFARKTIMALPFVVAIGIFNPLFDRETQLCVGTFAISGGWLSCASIMVRATLTISAGLILVAVTGFNPVCEALERLGMPQPLVVQLLFMYRYLFVLADDAARASNARAMRSFGSRGMELRPFASMIGNLLLKSWERAERIYMAMRARGFNGEFSLQRRSRFSVRDITFVVGWLTIFGLLRFDNLALRIGNALTRLFFSPA